MTRKRKSDATITTDEAGLLQKICRPRRDTPNVIAPAVEPEPGANELIGVAEAKLRAIAQGLIAEVREHRHLQHARVLLLTVSKPATAAKIDAGERVSIGKAGKANSLARLLGGVETAIDDDGEIKRARPDFIVRLSGDWLERIGWPDEPASPPQVAALIDHELCHCGAKIAGEFVGDREVRDREAELGDDLIETCRDVTNADGEMLVRYYWRDKDGRLKWCMKKHEVEEFAGVAERHGTWTRPLEKLCDVMVARDKTPLFDGEGEEAAKDRAAGTEEAA